MIRTNLLDITKAQRAESIQPKCEAVAAEIFVKTVNRRTRVEPLHGTEIATRNDLSKYIRVL